MTVKSQSHVHEYTSLQAETVSVLENLLEFVQGIPAPDDDGSIHGIDYGHLGSLQQLHKLLGEASQIADEFWS